MTSVDILNFWFNEIPRANWFKKDLEFDKHLTARFLKIHSQAVLCELFTWRNSASGRLAEIIVLDQFSRNMFRDSPGSFNHDPLALSLAQHAVEVSADQDLPLPQRSFLYMPYMHSESPAIHSECIRLFSQPGLENNLKFAIAHKNIIDRFGRYPHRNHVLGRVSTPEELEFLQSPGSSF